MTLIARLPNSSEIIQPAVLLRTGKASAREIDREFKGGKYYCPLCEGFREQKRSESFGRLTETFEALEYMDFKVGYRCASYTEISRVKKHMHFSHPKGMSKLIQQLAGIDIHEGYNDNEHDLAVLSFIELFREQYREENGYKIEKEKLIKLDVPPIQRCPDIAIYESNQNNPVVAVEIQLSFQSFQQFQERNNHLLLIASEIQWYIKRSVYDRMGSHRRWLSDRDIPYFKFWVDQSTGKIVYELGSPPKKYITSENNQVQENNSEGKCTMVHQLGLSRYELEQKAEKIKQKPGSKTLTQVQKPQRLQSNKVKQRHENPNLITCKIGDIIQVQTSKGWEKGEVINFQENGLPKVEIKGKYHRIHDCWSWDFVKLI
ncbi:hypothetical protein PCC8801_3555 [Rippkaea orientalis PCC 8801]|uniref:Uncharacterized protein n=1 Tax=Rippkaea orientalis (strain PCC 8801 / RF-1) TaxID=41431 RepID=B7K1H7_RIPO1|nr:hypothetical protein [Rippkaea orientalis]ACK67519.1 hypothetical protein PCC8801_3555 [Rippkaea orientalis PCC 8801]